MSFDLADHHHGAAKSADVLDTAAIETGLLLALPGTRWTRGTPGGVGSGRDDERRARTAKIATRATISAPISAPVSANARTATRTGTLTGTGAAISTTATISGQARFRGRQRAQQHRHRQSGS